MSSKDLLSDVARMKPFASATTAGSGLTGALPVTSGGSYQYFGQRMGRMVTSTWNVLPFVASTTNWVIINNAMPAGFIPVNLTEGVVTTTINGVRDLVVFSISNTNQLGFRKISPTTFKVVDFAPTDSVGQMFINASYITWPLANVPVFSNNAINE